MTYQGQGRAYVFDSVPPQKRRGFDVKADYSIRRGITSRIARRRGKFVSSEKSSGSRNSSDGGCAARRRQGETTGVQPVSRLTGSSEECHTA
ncbi:hypothetical protein PVAP13_8NG148702 [Panicum virgatum]|uniref:Uncharacterized protein n=1 Tax=Panicum virgatum TaxID=38727 RepID=A0A8T0P805_PANVG|nr:hypothetical protein PVAP13_8NG148702 [Panicum virgatum]